MFKFDFIEKRNKFNQINKEIILNYWLVKNTSLRK